MGWIGGRVLLLEEDTSQRSVHIVGSPSPVAGRRYILDVVLRYAMLYVGREDEQGCLFSLLETCLAPGILVPCIPPWD
jgi:hypothetical protein